MEIITPKEQIRKFFFEKHFDFLSSVPQRRLQEIILSSCMKGNSGKTVDYAEGGTVHRTTYGHFLAKGKWDDKKLEETQKRESFQTISELSRANGTPIFVSIDDTVVPKTAPSSKAKRPTQGAGWHYSHLEGKVVYGYQVHATEINFLYIHLKYSNCSVAEVLCFELLGLKKSLSEALKPHSLLQRTDVLHKIDFRGFMPPSLEPGTHRCAAP